MVLESDKIELCQVVREFTPSLMGKAVRPQRVVEQVLRLTQGDSVLTEQLLELICRSNIEIPAEEELETIKQLVINCQDPEISELIERIGLPHGIVGGHYDIDTELGNAVWGKTYQVREKNLPHQPYRILQEIIPPAINEKEWELIKERFDEWALTLYKIGKHEQIPELFERFQENGKFYLVQEFIEGESLRQVLTPDQQWQENDVIELLTALLQVLAFIHSHKVIHGNLKPSNIIREEESGQLVLIDFAGIKEITHTAQDLSESEISTLSMGSRNYYTPAEQVTAQPVYSSDLYAVGMIAIEALTGLSSTTSFRFPLNTHHNIIWRRWATVSDRFADILDQMVCYDFRLRYQSASEVLEALDNLKNPHQSQQITYLPDERENYSQPTPPDKSVPTPKIPNFLQPMGRNLAIAGGIILSILGLWLLWPKKNPSDIIATQTPPNNLQNNSSPNKIISWQDNPRFSQGNRMLITANSTAEKEAGIEAFNDKNWKTAITHFQQSLQKIPNDPETLIYLNNAQAMKQPDHYTIVTSIPIGGNLNVAQEMLRGVAQGQNEVNMKGGIKGIPLKVMIVNDDNNPDIAEQVAQQFVKEKKILAVVGHNSSKVSKTGAKIYQPNGLVMISPTSDAEGLPEMGNYIFRTVPSHKLEAETLANYAIKQARKSKFVICEDSNSTFSLSLSETFQEGVRNNGGNLSRVACDFADPSFNPSLIVSNAIADGVDGILLAPSVNLIDKALDIAEANQKRIALFSSSTMNTIKTLQVGQADVNGLVLAVIWHPDATPNSPFLQQSFALWRGEVNWRTALSYDAVKVIAAGLRENPTRQGLQQTLSNPNFAIPGAVGDIQFLMTGERERTKGLSILLRVEPQINSPTGIAYNFVPIEE